MRLCLAAYLCICVLAGWVDGSAFQELDQSPETSEAVKIIQGLKDRRLFQLAHRYADARLISDDIDRPGRSAIVLEQIKTRTAEAISLSGEQRQNAWRAALQIAEDFSSADPDHPRRILIDVQVALTHLSHGSLIGQEVAAEIVPDSAKEQALAQFRRAASSFRQVEKEIDRLLPIQRSRTLATGDLTPEQLVNLKNNVRYQLARINLARAELYEPADRLNQIDALNQVLNRLDEVLSQSNPQVPIWWNAQISRARCFRLMGNSNKAAQVFVGLPEVELTAELRTGILTEKLLIAASPSGGDESELLRAVEKIKNPSAQLQLAHLQLLMSVASRQQSTARKQWQDRATKLVGEIEATHGRYWGRRAEILLIGTVQPPVGKQPLASSDFEILIRQADAAFRKKNYNDAIRAYEKAAEFAEQSGDADRTIALTVRVARCHELEKQHQQAAERLFDVAMRYPQANDSAVVYLRGCWNRAQITEGNADKLAAYMKCLENQIATWPDSTSADQARLWLGHSYQSNSQWESATRTYLDIDVDSSHLLTAVQYIGPCVKRWMDSCNTADESTSAALQFVQLVRKKLNLQEADGKSEWNETERWLLLSMIEIGLPINAVDSADALRLIDASSAASTDEDNDWRQQSGIWRIVAMARQHVASAELEKELKQLPNKRKLMRLGFEGLQKNLDSSQRASYSSLFAMICDKALVDDNDGQQQTFWKLNRAIAEIDGGDIQTGVAALAELASQRPRSQEIQLAYARALTKQGTDLPAAISQWRRCAVKLRKGTDAWFEAKYNIILLMRENNQAAEARKLLDYLKITSPEWQKSNWKTRFESLSID